MCSLIAFVTSVESESGKQNAEHSMVSTVFETIPIRQVSSILDAKGLTAISMPSLSTEYEHRKK